LSWALAGCSLAGLDDLELARCSNDADCAGLNDGLSPDACDVFRCVAETSRCALAPVDADGDGDRPMACGGGDCDDDDATRSSTTTEICNGIDDDCDTMLDGPDEDDDMDGAADLCAGLGMVGDCDDQDRFTFIGAIELCDGVDNDCLVNGVTRVDGGEQLEPSEDVDGDGHSATDASCGIGGSSDPRFLPLDDCDDEAATTYGGALERCDGIDNDCDGTLDNVPDSTSPGTTCLPIGLYAGYDGTCALNRFGELVCWGANDWGQLGDDEAAPDAALVLPFLSNPTDVGIGSDFICAVTDAGAVQCWGTTAVLGREFMTSFNSGGTGEVPGVDHVTQIAAGTRHACAIREDRTVVCWGVAHPWPVFDGTFTDSTFSSLARVTPGIDDAIDIGTSGVMTCALRAGGTVWCWGFNFEGILGTGMTDSGPDPVVGIDDATDLSVGDGFACAIRADGSVWCWGGNATGSAGCPSCGDVAEMPARVAGLDGLTIEELETGGAHACVRTSDATVYCWGANDAGQLGPTAGARNPTALAIEGLIGVREIALGLHHTCARTDDGISCFGASGQRQLGDGRNNHSTDSSGAPFWRALPQKASVLAHPVLITGGADETCFLMPDSRVRCVGADAFGEIGGTPPFNVARPVFGITDATHVAVGGHHSCIVKRDGRLHCAGLGTHAQIGNVVDGIVEGIENAAEVACGENHTCVRRTDGTVACFGDHYSGQLGTGSLSSSDSCMGFIPCSRTPQEVTGIDDAEAIVAGIDHTCVLRESGEVACWGRNTWGELGSAPRGVSRIAREVTGLPADDPVREIEANGRSTCARVVSGRVWCWGQVLGATDGSITIDPVEIAGLANVAELAMMNSALCARLASGAVRCVGTANSGQLGNGVLAMSTTTPVGVRFLEDAATIGCGSSQCCAVRRSGQAVCWGRGTVGQLGDASTNTSAVPVSTASLTFF
jgi:alpha-tubulin suppressor-like RCC1 family protein